MVPQPALAVRVASRVGPLVWSPGGRLTFTLALICANVAVTLFAAVIVTVHVVAVDVSQPLQPMKLVPTAETAVKVTDAPGASVTVQVVPQVMPSGALVTVPLPDPALMTVSTRWAVKVAVTDFAADMVTVQVVAVEASQPAQVVNVEPEDGLAVRVTCVPGT